MRYLFVARIYGLKINRTLNRGVQVIEDLRLSTNGDRLKTVCDDVFKNYIGILEYNDLFSGPFVYAEGQYEYQNEADSEFRMDLLNNYMALSQTITSALWLIKDNGIRTEQGFLYIYDEKDRNNLETASVSSNARTSYYLNSRGENHDTEYTYDEVLKGLEIYSTFFNDNGHTFDQSETANIVTTKANRIERFAYFLQSARNQAFLPNRISSYCTGLETLLSTDGQEISHKISERMARILGKDYPSREKIFKFIKAAYSIRSANVHGDKLPRHYRNIEKQYSVSTDLDNYLRMLLIYILFNEELREIYIRDNKDELLQWFNKLTLS